MSTESILFVVACVALLGGYALVDLRDRRLRQRNAAVFQQFLAVGVREQPFRFVLSVVTGATLVMFGLGAAIGVQVIAGVAGGIVAIIYFENTRYTHLLITVQPDSPIRLQFKSVLVPESFIGPDAHVELTRDALEIRAFPHSKTVRIVRAHFAKVDFERLYGWLTTRNETPVVAGLRTVESISDFLSPREETSLRWLPLGAWVITLTVAIAYATAR